MFSLNNVENTPTTSTLAPILAEIIDTSYPSRANKFTSFSRSNSQSSRSSSSETAAMPQDQAIDATRDFHLTVLRKVLERIKQSAADMGFDSTMQVSIIDVSLL